MKRFYFYIALIMGLVACKHETPMVSLGIDDVYAIERMRPLILRPAFSGDRYEWTMLAVDGSDSLVSAEREFIFCQVDTGTYHLRLQVVDKQSTVTQEIKIVVWEEQVAYSRYISTVYEYRPAPGQFVNELPQYEEGNTAADMAQKAQARIAGTNDQLITLGGFGGYVTFGFDHSVVNVRGQYDFKILGNAFYSVSSTNPKGGSCEPGIVEVSFDRNQNGLPDDTWYELAGSAYRHADTRHHYQITYYRPDEDHVAIPKKSESLTDTAYIFWRDNDGQSGYISKNAFHQQDYFPRWLSDTITFTGTRLPKNAVKAAGNYWLLYAFDWGYADNHPNDSTDLVSFDIDWAVDADGNSVHLPCIDFVRVYTAENQTCGWIGETSTEISRAEDLHVAE